MAVLPGGRPAVALPTRLERDRERSEKDRVMTPRWWRIAGLCLGAQRGEEESGGGWRHGGDGGGWCSGLRVALR